MDFTGSINVVADSPVQYSCTGVGHDILYLVNGSTASNFVSEGFISQVGHDTLNNNIIRRNLTLISATIDLNNTKVQCRLAVIDPPNPTINTFSNISTLRIQGWL